MFWRFFIHDHIILFLLMWIILGSCQATERTGSPNIIIILADDMGYSDISCFGSEIPTPNIDYLSDQGLTMTHFYNASRCCPTRASLLTGMYPHQAGMGDMVEGRLLKDSTFLSAYQGWLNEKTPTIAELLKEAGYQTFISGKWHVGDAPEYWPDKRGFDRSFSLINGASNYFNLEPWIREDQEIILIKDGKKITTSPDLYMTTAITEHGLDFIRQRDHKKPFFLYLSYTAPHWPLHALPEDITKFEGQYLKGWDRLRNNRFRRLIDLGILDSTTCLTDPFYANPLITPAWDILSGEDQETWGRRMAVYAAQIYRMDLGIGEIIRMLRKEKELENSLIMFLSDNGATNAAIYLAASWAADRSGPIGSANSFDAYGARWANASNTPFKLFKHWTTEGGIATPFIAFWPQKISPRLENRHYAHVIDLLPTCLDAAGLSDGQNLPEAEGISLLPVFLTNGQNPERILFWEHQGSWAVRKGKWKLVHTKKIMGREVSLLELFDLEEDRAECHDLSSEYPEIVRELKELYEKWASRAGVVPWDSLILAREL